MFRKYKKYNKTRYNNKNFNNIKYEYPINKLIIYTN